MISSTESYLRSVLGEGSKKQEKLSPEALGKSYQELKLKTPLTVI